MNILLLIPILILLSILVYDIKKTNRLLIDVLKELQKDSPVPPPTKVTVSTSPPTKPHKNLCQILQKVDGKLTLVGWVRKDSPAWKKVYDAKGFYLKDPNGNIEEGVQ